MKSLKNAISLAFWCLLLSTLVSVDATARTKSKRLQKSSAKIVKCKDNDSDCFIRAANICQKATLTMSQPSSLWNPNAPHPTQTQTSRYEIRGRRNGKCIFYSKIEKNDIDYDEAYVRYLMKEEGKTRQEVEQMLSEQREAFRQTAGRDGVCSFQTERLSALLNRWWQKGGGTSFSTNDFEGADCQGTLYNFTLPNQTIKTSKPLDETAIKQKIVFERHHTNNAKGYRYTGIYIDNEGNVYSYAYARSDQKWQPKEKGSYTEEELLEKYNHAKKFVAKIDPNELRAKYELIEEASKGGYSEQVEGGRDMGELASICYLYDPQADKYKEIDLTVKGDCRYENLSESANVLAIWLETISTGDTGLPYSHQTSGSADPQDEETAEQNLWDAIKGGADSQEYKTFLAKYPQGQYGGEARARLNTLLGADYVTLFMKWVNLNRQWATVEKQLERRADVIPSLITSLQEAGVKEPELFGQIARARSQLLNAIKATPRGEERNKTPEQKRVVIDADQSFGRTLKRLDVLLKNYPQLRSNDKFLKIQDELAGTENRIAAARTDYNLDVQDYSTARSEPRMAGVAEHYKFTAEPYFEAK